MTVVALSTLWLWSVSAIACAMPPAQVMPNSTTVTIARGDRGQARSEQQRERHQEYGLGGDEAERRAADAAARSR